MFTPMDHESLRDLARVAAQDSWAVHGEGYQQTDFYVAGLIGEAVHDALAEIYLIGPAPDSTPTDYTVEDAREIARVAAQAEWDNHQRPSTARDRAVAGQLGVAVFDAFRARDALRAESDDPTFLAAARIYSAEFAGQRLHPSQHHALLRDAIDAALRAAREHL
jgi:hypothetical protein